MQTETITRIATAAQYETLSREHLRLFMRLSSFLPGCPEEERYYRVLDLLTEYERRMEAFEAE